MTPLSKMELETVIKQRGNCSGKSLINCPNDCLYSCEIYSDSVHELSDYRDILDYKFKTAVKLYTERYGIESLFDEVL